MKTPFVLASSVVAFVLASASASTATPAGITVRVGVTGSGQLGNGDASAAGISADGRYVAFTSSSSNLVSGDTNGKPDAFVRDLQSNVTERVSVSGSGAQGNFESAASAISAGGRYVVFDSNAFNLVRGDFNDQRDVFVRDGRNGRTTLVSVSSKGRQGNGDSSSGVISADGRYVAFLSYASNLVPRDSNHTPDVFVHDLRTGRTIRADVSSRAKQANRGADSVSLSANGRYVAFASDASNLVPRDTNRLPDVFVRDLRTARTARVSVSNRGKQATDRLGNGSTEPSISADGRYVAFASSSANLVAHDTNRRPDIFVRDRKLGKTIRVSVGANGAQADAESREPAISPDGQDVAFTSFSNLTAVDSGGRAELYVRRIGAGKTVLASIATDGGYGNDYSGPSAGFGANGRFLAFTSYARNLVPGDAEDAPRDAFVRDFGAAETATAGSATSSFTANRQQTFSRLVAPGDRLVYRVSIQTPTTGTLYLRTDRSKRCRKLALNVKGQWLSARLPVQLLRGRELFYYAVIHDPTSGSSATVPAGGAQAPDRAWILKRPLFVRLGAHRFGHTRAPGKVVARIAADQVGWDISDEYRLGPQTFVVGRDGSIWLQDSFNNQLLRWPAGEPDAVPSALSLPGYAAQGDLALGPAGTVYVSAPGDRNWPSAVFRLSPSGEVLWRADLPEQLRGNFPLPLRTGPDGTLYSSVGASFAVEQGARGWMPVTTPDGRPLTVPEQLAGLEWGSQRVTGRLRLVAETDTLKVDAPIHEVRVALVDVKGRVVRAWRIQSRTQVAFFPGGSTTPELVGGNPLVVLDFSADPQTSEHVVLRLGPQGARVRFALPDAVYGDDFYADLRVGPDGNLYQLATSPSRGVEIRRFSLYGRAAGGRQE
jgi:Tol biopolymer transport system component